MLPTYNFREVVFDGYKGIDWYRMKTRAGGLPVPQHAVREHDKGRGAAQRARLRERCHEAGGCGIAVNAKGLEAGAYDCHAAPDMALAFASHYHYRSALQGRLGGKLGGRNGLLCLQQGVGRHGHRAPACKERPLRELRCLQASPGVEVGLSLGRYLKLLKVRHWHDIHLA